MNEFVITINDKKLSVSLNEDSNAKIDGKEYSYQLSRFNNNTCKVILNNKPYLLSAVEKGNSEFIIYLNGKVLETKVLSALQEKAANLIESKLIKHSLTVVKSPMPGMILKIRKKVGDEIIHGESVMILEAMKMENDIRSQVSGKIKDIKVKEGQAVEKSAILFSIE